jgi:DNA-binding response OmpR family regulator
MARLLIIEPDKQLAVIYQEALAAAGHVVAVCRNAASAINMIDTKRPDLLLVELELPTHNGVELLYELRSYNDWRKLPVVILTNQPFANNPRVSAVWKRLGVSGHYYKPSVTLSKLSQIVNRHLVPAAT